VDYKVRIRTRTQIQYRYVNTDKLKINEYENTAIYIYMNLLKFIYIVNNVKKKFIKKSNKRYNFYTSSSLKNIPSNSDSSRDKLAISRIPLLFNDKSFLAISHNLISSSLYFE